VYFVTKLSVSLSAFFVRHNVEAQKISLTLIF
jgi:hypothetical protein